MIRRARIDPPAGFTHGALGSAADGPTGTFWMVWCIGTFGPLLSWYVLMHAGAQGTAMPWLLWTGVILLVFNCCLALITEGYEEGGLADFGYGVALLAGRTMIVIGTVVLLAFILIAWGVLRVTLYSDR